MVVNLLYMPIRFFDRPSGWTKENCGQEHDLICNLHQIILYHMFGNIWEPIVSSYEEGQDIDDVVLYFAGES